MRPASRNPVQSASDSIDMANDRLPVPACRCGRRESIPMSARVVRQGMRHTAVAASLVVAASLIAIADQAPPQDQRPTFRTEANYIRVDVYATTRDGTPINDLRREEFRLVEDRVPQAIDQFSPIAIRSGGSPSLRSDPRSPEESRQAATESRARVFVLFLD